MEKKENPVSVLLQWMQGFLLVESSDNLDIFGPRQKQSKNMNASFKMGSFLDEMAHPQRKPHFAPPQENGQNRFHIVDPE